MPTRVRATHAPAANPSPGVHGIHGVPIAVGSRSIVYARGADSVAKVPRAGTPSSWIRHEAAFTAMARSAGAPAPEVRAIEDHNEDHNGMTVAVYERIAGSSLWQHVADNQHAADNEHRAATAGVHLARIHAALFQLPAPVSLPSLAERLRCKIRNVAAADPSVAAFLHNPFPTDPPVAALCHGDLHPGNVIMGPTGPVVIDWFDVAVGDPMADVARTVLLLEESRPAHLPGGSDAIRALLARSYFAELQQRMTVDHSRVARWKVIHAVARRAERVVALEADSLLDHEDAKRIEHVR
jgi:thiamine kinase